MPRIALLLIAFTFPFCVFAMQHSDFPLVDTQYVFSPKMQKKIGVVIVLPQNYHTQKSKKFSVLYLLHGMSDNHTKWVNTVPNVKNLANQHQLIIVCPDGAYSGWYLDSPYDAQSQYESFIAKELLLFVDSQYRTLAGKKGRIISGLSMGGHGALYLAMRNPQNYAAAGSMSGAVDIYRLAANESLANETAKTLGKFEKNQDLWKKHSVLHNLDLLKKAQTAYIIDCGLDDFLLQENKDLHTAMVQEKIPHEYIERPGGHEWKYWEKAIETQLNFLCGYLQRE